MTYKWFVYGGNRKDSRYSFCENTYKNTLKNVTTNRRTTLWTEKAIPLPTKS